MRRDIEFSVHTWVFGPIALAESVSRAKAIGFDGIELYGAPRTFGVGQVKRIVSDAGLWVVAFCGEQPGADSDHPQPLCHPDPHERGRAVDYVKMCVDVASGLGARSALVVPSVVGRLSPLVSSEADLDAAADSLRKAAEHAESQKILLTIEPINRYEIGLVNSVAEAISLAERVDHGACRIMGDTFHMQLEEGDGIPNAIRRAGHHWFQHLHVADNTREAPGMGTMDWREILRALHDIELEGGVSLEPVCAGFAMDDALAGRIPADKLDQDLRIGLSHLREMQRLVRAYV